MRNDLQAAVAHLEAMAQNAIVAEADADMPEQQKTALWAEYKALDTALTALRDMLKRREGCEYCEKEKRIKNACYTNAFAEVCKHSKSFAVHMPLNFGSADCDFFINYCPMCGRKLEVEG